MSLKIAMVGFMVGASAWAASPKKDEVMSFKLDPSHTAIIFKINHLGFSNTYGQFPGTEGTFTINDLKPEKSTLDLMIKTDSVTTLEKKRDEHLRSPDFFNVKQFPAITFKSKSVKKTDATHYEITGDLTLHGVTKPVTFVFNRFKTDKDPWGNLRTGGETSFKIKRTDYNMNFMSEPGKVGDEVEMMISLEGIKT